MKFKLFKYITVVLTVIIVAVGLYLVLDKPNDNTEAEEPFQILLEENIDWESIQIEASDILTALIQIPTIRKDEVKAALYIQKVLEKEGIQAKLIPHPEFPDKVSVVAEIGPESSENGVILLNHLDVVEVEEANWKFPPFSGDLKDGIIHGRGALDMKGMATMQLMSFIMMNRMQFKLTNKIMFLSVPDEESGGKLGAQFLLEKHPYLFDGYKYVLNEGGFGIKDFPNPGNKIFNIQTAEKGVLGVEFVSQGQSGHGSMPDTKYSSLNMLKFLEELQTIQKFELTPQSVEFFQALASFYDFPQSFLLARLQNPLVQKLIGNRVREKKSTNAMVSNTVSITKVETETLGQNVIPAKTVAYTDIRVLPGVEPETLFQEIQVMAKKYDITAEMKTSSSPTQSSSDTNLFDVLSIVLKDNVKDAAITQYLSPGATDSRFFREKGFECYGIVPILISMEEVSMLHGVNESISLENLKLGTKVLFETLVGFNQMESL